MRSGVTMKAKYVQKGETVDYTPVSDLEAGAVVRLGELAGITAIPIPAGMLGAVAVSGVFDVEKASAASFAIGDSVYWNFTSEQAETSGDFILGVAIGTALPGSDRVRILLRSEAVTEPEAPVIEWQTI